MNITNFELKAFKSLLTKEDLDNIARKTNKASSTVNAMFHTRHNDEIEREIFHTTKDKIAELQYLIQKVEAKNKTVSELSVNEYERLKKLDTWRAGHDYYVGFDCYLQFSHIKFNSIQEIVNQIRLEFKELLGYKFRIVEIIHRLTGSSVKEIINYLKTI